MKMPSDFITFAGSGVVSSELGSTLRRVHNEFGDQLAVELGQRAFSGSTRTIVFHPIIQTPDLPPIPEKTRYGRSDASIQFSVTIPGEQWRDSTHAGRINFYASAIRSGVEKFKETKFPQSDKDQFLAAVEAVRQKLG